MIRELSHPLENTSCDHYDVVVLGGTLGIFIATALRLRNYSVLVLERNQLRGRDQDWNISRADMQVGFIQHVVRLEHCSSSAITFQQCALAVSRVLLVHGDTELLASAR